MVLELTFSVICTLGKIILMQCHPGFEDEKKDNILLLCHNLFVSLSLGQHAYFEERFLRAQH